MWCLFLSKHKIWPACTGTCVVVSYQKFKNYVLFYQEPEPAPDKKIPGAGSETLAGVNLSNFLCRESLIYPLCVIQLYRYSPSAWCDVHNGSPSTNWVNEIHHPRPLYLYLFDGINYQDQKVLCLPFSLLFDVMPGEEVTGGYAFWSALSLLLLLCSISHLRHYLHHHVPGFPARHAILPQSIGTLGSEFPIRIRTDPHYGRPPGSGRRGKKAEIKKGS